MEIECIQNGIYRLHSDYDESTTTLTAQELRELFDWSMIHMRELEQEARQAVDAAADAIRHADSEGERQ